MSDETSSKFLIRRRSKIRTDGRGRAVWAEPIGNVEFELVSTLALKKILSSNDEKSRQSIAKAARQHDNGILAKDPASGQFDIISDDELQAIIDANPNLPPVSQPSEITLVPLYGNDEQAVEELSLVSTQALRKLLGQEDDESESVEDPGGGFDPYNKS